MKRKIYPYRNQNLGNNEKKFGLTLEQIQYIDWEIVEKRIDKIIEFYNNYDLQAMLPELYLIVKDFGHFEKVLNEINKEYCSRINKTLELHQITARLSFDILDIDQQFMPNKEKTKSEIFADIILLVDTLIEIFEEDNTKDNLRELVPGLIIDEEVSSESHEKIGIIPFLESIRQECLKELFNIRQEIELGKEKDERLLIYKHRPNNLPLSHKGFYYIVIPEYLEPIITSCEDVDPNPYIEDKDFVEISSTNPENDVVYHIFRFPIKITPEQEELIEQYAELTMNRFYNPNKNCVEVIKAYMHNQTFLDPFCNRISLLRYNLEELEQEIEDINNLLKKKYLRKTTREELQGKLEALTNRYDRFI